MKKLTDKQKKNLDKTGDGKISKEDFLLLRRLKKKKNGKAQSSQMRTLKKHSEHHSKKHMDMMKKLMREGSSFKAAHKKAQKDVGK